MYRYVKKPPKTRPFPEKISPRSRRLVAFSLLTAGAFFLFWAIFPIVSFQIGYSAQFKPISSPLSSRFYNQSGSILGDITTDYSQINNWFVGVTSPESTQLSFSQATYQISIPKLKIQNAVVKVDGRDLKKSLVQYPQTALPGQPGSAVIFGHSVLPQFFNPLSYMTIFSTLFKLKNGDDIYVTYDNITYKYLVEDMYEVLPTDLSVLEQRFDGRRLTLITCSPPGTYLRRLVVKALLADYQ